jgi:hypothetical protein
MYLNTVASTTKGVEHSVIPSIDILQKKDSADSKRGVDFVEIDLKSPQDIPNEGNILNVWHQFDKSFIICLFLCNFTQGFKQFLDLSLLNLFKKTLNL